LFPPEIPHGRIVGNGSVWLAITVGWMIIRYYLFCNDTDALKSVDKDARIQFILQQLDFSKMVFLGLIGAYIGLIVTWFQEIHLYNSSIDPDKSEVFLLNSCFTIDVAITSLFFLVAPVYEVAKQRIQFSKLLLEIPRENG
jgi:hypothetical protein